MRSSNHSLPCCISHEFHEKALQNPTRIAVIHATSPSTNTHHHHSSPPINQPDQSFTYAQLLNAVNLLASRLRFILDADHSSPLSSSLGERSGLMHRVEESGKCRSGYRPKIVGVLMPPSVEYIVSVLSVLRAGEAFLPLDPSWPRQRVLSIISSSTADAVITSESLFGISRDNKSDGLDWIDKGSDCQVLRFSMEESELERGDCSLDLAWPCQKEEGRLFCYLMYTSGSTGKPKGVCGTEQGLLNRFFWMQELYPLRGLEVLLFKTAISFIDHLQEFLCAILTACVLVIPPFNELKENPCCLVNYLQAYSINRLVAVPSLMRAILAALRSPNNIQFQHSLKLLVVSGEVFPLSLWEALANILPNTSILNLYGSTEVAGDCTYFDCKRLPAILEKEVLTAVPIGVPIINCNVKLVGESDTSNEGEIYVGGLCLSSGYFPESIDVSFDHVTLHDNHNCLEDDRSLAYFKTGDFARRLQIGGDLVFVGRRDRTVKVNGQRIALDEIEIALREHPDIIDAAVVLRDCTERLFLEAFFMLESHSIGDKDFVSSSIRSWMVNKVPLAMIPNSFQLIDSLPMSSSGKVDYAVLASSASSKTHIQDEDGNTITGDLLQQIKKAFCNALSIEEFSSDSDFFMMGGNSIAAAHVSYNLGIDIRLLYKYSTLSKLHSALSEINKSCSTNGSINGANGKLTLKDESATLNNSLSSVAPQDRRRKSQVLDSPDPNNNVDHTVTCKRFKFNMEKIIPSEDFIPSWESTLAISMSTSFFLSRGNKVLYRKGNELRQPSKVVSSLEIPGAGFPMKELWRVHLESCVDASPLVVFKDHDVYVFIGSHSHKFISINAKSGSILWEVKLEGRIECSAAIVSDFSQVVVGCYMGKIYFLDFLNGNVCWTYQTFGEVKCQPAVDTCRELIWCGSHDHNLYGLDYKRHCCIFKLSCGGSIYGSPAVDEVHKTLYVASTSGRVTAISLSVSPFHCLWKYDLEVPVFGSLSVCSPSGNVVCCMVDGNIVAFNLDGCVIWRSKTGGPVFAGPCISHMLPSQVLICSRNGTVYSFEMEKGDLLWEYNIGAPITASAYVDEHLELVSNPSNMPDRLVSVCTSPGNIYLLRLNHDVTTGKENHPCEYMVKEFARLDLEGDIFSSPVMAGGKIFVGCRDDYVHCVTFEIKGCT